MKNRVKLMAVAIGVGVTALLLYCCNFDGKGESVELDRAKIMDLRTISNESNKTYAQILIDEIPKYSNYKKNFELSFEYSPDYILTTSETKKELSEHYTSSTHAVYISSKTQEEIDIYVLYFESPESAQAEWIESLEMYSIPKLAPADKNNIIVGDVAVGTQRFLNFIRGNIGIHIRGVNGNSVVEVAEEIDNQILMALYNAKK